MTAVSDDDQMKQSPPLEPPPANHCRSSPPNNDDDDVKPLDLSKKQNEQPLNLCSKRKRTTPVCLSKRPNHTNTNTVSSSLAPTNLTPSMFLPFYTMTPFFDSNITTNQQELLQQMQTYYLQLQQKLTQNQ